MGRPSHHVPVKVWASSAKCELSFFAQGCGPTRMAFGTAIMAAGLDLLSVFNSAGFSDHLGFWRHLILFAILAPFAVRYALVHARRQRWCKAALANMWQGLVLYDGDGRLLLYNSQFCRMLGLSPAGVRRAARHRDVIELSVAAGNHDGLEVEQVRLEDAALVALGKSALAYIDLPDGRTIAEAHQPIAGGGWIRTYADVTGRRQAEARVIHMARYDALTDLPNRVLFHERLQRALEDASERASVAVMFLDLDRFKAVNDTLGHAAGDLLLQHVASRLRGALRDCDTVARLGGDEFAVVQTGIEDDIQVDELARRLIAVVSAPYNIEGVRVTVGTSVGITLAPRDGTVADDLLKSADMALYEAKAAGRGVFRFYVAEMDAQIRRRRALEADLREALRCNQIEVHYQPLVNLRTFRIVAFEALLRWQHPACGMIAPSEFIPIAEDIGLIDELGAWVLREACQTAAQWPEDIGIAVNVSPVQFRGEHIVSTVTGALTYAGLRADRLELEVTESVLLQSDGATLSALHQLIELGAHVVMDDFGTGYSSLGSLSRFPFQTIKIDRSFVEEVVRAPSALAIVRAVSQLGRSLGMKVTAEGIETVEQLARVIAEECTTGQGYLFGRPMPQSAIASYLDEWPVQSAALTTRNGQLIASPASRNVALGLQALSQLG